MAQIGLTLQKNTKNGKRVTNTVIGSKAYIPKANCPIELLKRVFPQNGQQMDKEIFVDTSNS